MTSRSLATALALGLTLSASASRGDDWRVSRHDPQRTGRSTGRLDLPSPAVRWRHYLGGAVSPEQCTITDIDRDGVSDVVFVSSGKVIAKRADDTLVWESPLVGARTLSAVTDLDGDGRREVVVTADLGGVLVIDGGDGHVLWEVPAALRGLGAQVRVGDLDGDGFDELYVGECVRNPVAALALSFRGGFASPRELWRIPTLPDACGTVADAIGDMNGDGAPELVMALGYDHMRVFDGRTGALSIDLQPPPSGLFGTFTTPLLRNVDGEPGLELILVTNGYRTSPIAYGARRIAVYKHRAVEGRPSLSLLWESNGPDAPTGSVAFEVDSVTDLDGDGALELTASFYDGNARRWTLETRDARTGALRATRSDAELVGMRDLDGDGRAEAMVVEGDRSTVLLRWEGTGWVPRWSIEGRRPARMLDLTIAARERFWTRPLAMQLDDDPGAELVLAPFDPDIPAEARVITSLEGWDLGANGLTRLGRLDAPPGTAVLTATMGESLSRPYAQPVAVTSDGYLLALDREMVSTNRIVTAEFTIPGMRVGGYFSGSSVLGHTPVVGDVGAERAIFVRDARPSLLRLDARSASLSTPPTERWSRPRSAYPALVDLDGDGVLDLAATEGRDVVGLSAADGAARWTARDVASLGMTLPGDVLPLRLRDGSTQLALLRGDSAVRVRPAVLRARDGSVLWNDLVRPTTAAFGQLTVADLDGDGGDELLFAATNFQRVDGERATPLSEGPAAPYGVQIVAPFRGAGPEVFTAASARPDRLLSATLSLQGEGALADFSSPYGAVVRCGESTLVAVSPIGSSELRLLEPARLRSDGGERAIRHRAFLASGRAYPSAEAVPSGARAGAFANLTSVAALDSRGEPGLLVGSADGHLYALDACTLALRWAMDFRYPVGEPVVADTDGDGDDDLLVSVGDGYLYALGARTLPASSEVRDLEGEGGAEDVDEVESASIVHARWSAVPGATSYQVRVLTQSGTAIRFPDYARAVTTEARFDGLPMRLGGRYRIGVVAESASGSSEEALSDGFVIVDRSDPEARIEVITPRFAPSLGERGEIVLRFTDRTAIARVRAELRDRDGRVVTVLDDEAPRTTQPARTTRVSWNGTDDATRTVVPLGVYQIVAEVEDGAGHRARAEASIEVTNVRTLADGGTTAPPTPEGCGCRARGGRLRPQGAMLTLGLALASRARRRRRMERR